MSGCSFVLVNVHSTFSPAVGVNVALRVSTFLVPLEQVIAVSL